MIKPSIEEMKQSGVYKISNSVNNEFYIGSCKHFARRLATHFHDCKRGRGNRGLCKFIQEHGKDKLIFTILKIVNNNENLKHEEQRFILKEDFSKMWNISRCAFSPKGVKMPDSHRKASRERMLGNTLTKGMKASKEAVEKRKNFWKNNPIALERMKENNRKTQLNIDRSNWKSGNIYHVIIEGEKVETILGLNNFRDKYKVPYVSASKLSTGKIKTYKGISLVKTGRFVITDNMERYSYNNGDEFINIKK